MTKFYLSFSRYLTVLLVMVSTIAWSQSRTVTGTVTSADDGSGLPGVNVVEKGTSNGTVTDVDGKFSVNVGENATLVFSFVGFTSQEVAVGAQSTINVTLTPDVRALSEVVVIGYGEINRRDATGAVASVKAEDFNRGVIASPEQLIQGKTAGVQITQASGEPGAGVNIRIRGTTSVRGGNNPLFVVDGVPLGGNDVSAGGFDFGRGGGSPKNPLNFINPNDIESIDILKDASATAIYGSRGANGVVIITTKSGKGRKHQLDYSGGVSFSTQAKTYDVLNAKEFLDAYTAPPINGDRTVADKGGSTFWQDEINQTAISQNHNLAFANSYKGGNYRASLSWDDQEGIIKETGLERKTARLNLNHGFFEDKLKFGTQVLISRVEDEAAPITNSAGFEGDLIASSIFYNPTIPADARNYAGDAANPLSLLKYHHDQTRTNRHLLNFSLGYDILKELNFKVNTGFDRSNSMREAAMSGFQERIPSASGIGRAFYRAIEYNSDLLEAFLTYNKNFGSSSLNILAGYSYQEFRNRGQEALAAGFEDWRLQAMIDDLHEADDITRERINVPFQRYAYQEGVVLRAYQLFPDIQMVRDVTRLPSIPTKSVVGSNDGWNDELQSFFARGNYNLNEKYFFTASIRADGSTKFGDNNKYGVFPAAAVKWRLSDEDFAPELFDDLAIRLGYGVTGNQEIGHNLYTTRANWNGEGLNNAGELTEAANLTWSPGTTFVTYYNPDLQWESTATINFGIDYGFFNNRLNGSIDAYSKNTTKLLMLVYQPAPAAQPYAWRNLDADVMNTGVELTVNAVAIDKQDLGLNLGFNVSYNKNMVKNYDAPPVNTGVINGQGLTDSYAQRIADNQPLGAYFLRDWKGFTPEGLNDDDDQQKFVGKSALPKYNLGFNASFRFKGFDIAAYMNGQMGHYVYNNVANAMFTKGSLNGARNVVKSVVTSKEAVANSPDVSTRFLEKGDFLRMQNVSVGYSFELEESAFFKKLRVSATGQNLFLITNYSGLDPEVNVDKNIRGIPSIGIDYTAYPRAKTVSFGVNATF